MFCDFNRKTASIELHLWHLIMQNTSRTYKENIRFVIPFVIGGEKNKQTLTFVVICAKITNSKLRLIAQCSRIDLTL